MVNQSFNLDKESYLYKASKHWSFFKNVAGGSCHSIAVHEDGSLWGWGDNCCGQLGNSTLPDHLPTPTKICHSRNFHSVVAGDRFSLILDIFGRVWSLGTDICENLDLVQIPGLRKIVQIAAGYQFGLALDRSGNVFSFGMRDYRECSWFQQIGPRKIKEIDVAVKEISCGLFHSLAVDVHRKLWVFGRNVHGELGVGKSKRIVQPEKNPHLQNISNVWCGAHNSFVKNEHGELWAFGQNTAGQLGIGNTENQFLPVLVDLPVPVNFVISGSCHTFVVDVDGNIYSCGRNDDGRLGLGDKISRYTFHQIPNIHHERKPTTVLKSARTILGTKRASIFLPPQAKKTKL
jgi:alpha-tubulin suppressor-like RCC1 family protein